MNIQITLDDIEVSGDVIGGDVQLKSISVMVHSAFLNSWEPISFDQLSHMNQARIVRILFDNYKVSMACGLTDRNYDDGEARISRG